MGICFACCQSGIQKNVMFDDIMEPLPAPDTEKVFPGNPPQDPNLVLELTANVSRQAFLHAWIDVLAYKVIKAGDDNTRSLGFEKESQLSHSAIVEERIGPHLLISMKANSTTWTVRGYDKLPPVFSGLTNIVDVVEIPGQTNKIKIRIVGRFDLFCVPAGLLRKLIEDMYLDMIKKAAHYEKTGKLA